MTDKVIPVKVAVRCRPLVNKEIESRHEEGVEIYENKCQVVVSSKAFSYDYVFGTQSSQNHIYQSIILPNLRNALEGYNLTVLAYGQTGSGKTHTMGTQCFDIDMEIFESSCINDIGIIPNAINDIFKMIKVFKSDVELGSENHINIDYRVSVSFLEIYKEDIIDLLNTESASTKEKESLVIREDPNYGIKLVGLKEIPVSNLLEALSFLEMGSAIRSTASTAMNSTSSRSHAIFTLTIEKLTDEAIVTRSKIHFVDLAGSERVKKTLAEGERFKEGVNINRGLLALGNVINALSEDSKRKNPTQAQLQMNVGGPASVTDNGYYIPYRDSKLTRILQDSLGGNSHTIMIACISPSLYNVEETLNTLRYADRARKIKNKPIVNSDPVQEEFLRLKNKVKELEDEISKNKASVTGILQDGKRESAEHAKRDCIMYKAKMEKVAHELQNSLETIYTLETELDIAKKEADFYRSKISALASQPLLHGDPTMQNATLLDESTIEKEREEYINKLKDQQNAEGDGANPNKTALDVNDILNQVEMSSELKSLSQAITDKENLVKQMQSNESEMAQLREKYQKEIEDLLKEKDSLNQALSEAHRNKTVKSDLSEKRRKKLQELEAKITSMQKKISDHDKLIKIKEQNKVLIDKLKTDITELKQNRVKLIRKMKEEGEKLRKLQQAKDKDALQFKSNMRKKEVQLSQMETKYQMEQRVLKRKNEEILANNRRLMEALAKRQRVQDAKLEKQQKQASNSKKQETNQKHSFSNNLNNNTPNKTHPENGHSNHDNHQLVLPTILTSDYDLNTETNAQANAVIEKLQGDMEIMTCLQLSRKYISQLCVERKDLINQINAIQDQMEENQKGSNETSSTTGGYNSTLNNELHSIDNNTMDSTSTDASREPLSAKDAELVARINQLQDQINIKSQQISTLQDQSEEVDHALHLNNHGPLNGSDSPSRRVNTTTPSKYASAKVEFNNLAYKPWDKLSNNPQALSKIIDWLAQFALDKNVALVIESQAKKDFNESWHAAAAHDNFGDIDHRKMLYLLKQEHEQIVSLHLQKSSQLEDKVKLMEQREALLLQENERLKKFPYPAKMFTPVGIRVKKNPRAAVSRISNSSKRKSHSSKRTSRTKRDKTDHSSNATDNSYSIHDASSSSSLDKTSNEILEKVRDPDCQMDDTFLLVPETNQPPPATNRNLFPGPTHLENFSTDEPSSTSAEMGLRREHFFGHNYEDENAMDDVVVGETFITSPSKNSKDCDENDDRISKTVVKSQKNHRRYQAQTVPPLDVTFNTASYNNGTGGSHGNNENYPAKRTYKTVKVRTVNDGQTQLHHNTNPNNYTTTTNTLSNELLSAPENVFVPIQNNPYNSKGDYKTASKMVRPNLQRIKTKRIFENITNLSENHTFFSPCIVKKK